MRTSRRSVSLTRNSASCLFPLIKSSRAPGGSTLVDVACIHSAEWMLLLVKLLAAAYSPVGPSSALALSLQQLDHAAAAHRRGGQARPAVASPIASPVFDACLGVCRSLDARATAASLAAAGKVPGVAATLRWRQSLLERHFVDERLVGGVLLEALAHVPAGQAELLEVADAVAASARFILLQPEERRATLDDLAAEVVSDEVLERRREALATSSSMRAWGGPGEADDERRAEALCRAVAPLLACRGFPGTPLGLRSFAAAARAAGSQRAAASLGRLWHAASEPGPLILAPAPPAAPSPPGGAAARTLVVAFSSLGWNGLVRAEWGATLRGAAAGEGLSAVVDVAFALDTACSWFTTDPITGAYDDCAWWDARLLELCAPYERVCLLGESMGGSAALRFARHATPTGAVVALAPQVDLRDFTCCGRLDFSDDRKIRLREAIAAAVDDSRSPVTLHLGRDADDLQQLSHLARHLPSLAAAFEAAGEQADAPQP